MVVASATGGGIKGGLGAEERTMISANESIGY